MLKDLLIKMDSLTASTSQHTFFQNFVHRSYYDLLLKEGSLFTETKEVDFKLGQKHCYYNCFSLVEQKPHEFIYCEGYTLVFGLATAHAWLLTSDFKVLDPTLGKQETEYFGIPFSSEWLIPFMRKRAEQDNFSVIEGNYLENFSFLRMGPPADAKAKSSKVPEKLDFSNVKPLPTKFFYPDGSRPQNDDPVWRSGDLDRHEEW